MMTIVFQLFDSQMSAACETLELAKTELYVAGQSISGTPANTHAHTALINAAKDVLQAVLRVSESYLVIGF